MTENEENAITDALVSLAKTLKLLSDRLITTEKAVAMLIDREPKA